MRLKIEKRKKQEERNNLKWKLMRRGRERF